MCDTLTLYLKVYRDTGNSNLTFHKSVTNAELAQIYQHDGILRTKESRLQKYEVPRDPPTKNPVNEGAKIDGKKID